MTRDRRIAIDRSGERSGALVTLDSTDRTNGIDSPGKPYSHTEAWRCVPSASQCPGVSLRERSCAERLSGRLPLLFLARFDAIRGVDAGLLLTVSWW